MPRQHFAGAAGVVLAAFAASVLAAGSRDGRNFDVGTTMTSPAAGAPEALAALTGLLGRWHVALQTGEGEAVTVAPCQAEITFFNRGHGYMERLHCADWNGRGEALAAMALLTYNPASDLWLRGEANSYTESIRVAQGHLSAGVLELHDAVRPGGGALLEERRLRWVVRPSSLELTEELSTDGGRTWTLASRRAYARADAVPALARREDFGIAAPGLPPEARQFDFLLGDFVAQNDFTFPNGQRVQWPANSTGVLALDGHAVVEFNWFDVDPQLPDAATTIIRLYNRAMRRWESLFMPNRGQSILHFGGRWETDRMVLHPFGTDASAGTLSRFVFHSVETDRFGWYAEQSTDRGATWAKTWLIDTERRPEPEDASGSP